ncbi:MAG: prepilin-type N-terminal cleavage/methylation domain-containing protein [Candidatus Uhrbacteria bacterium]
MKKAKSKQRGFTLVELILYIGLSAVILSSLGTMINISYQVRARQQVTAEVEQQGTVVTQIVSQIIRNASSITSPVAGASATSAVMAVSDVSKTPTTFSLSGTAFQLTENATVTALTNDQVQVSALSFKNLSAATTPGTVKFQFTLNYTNPGGTPRFTYSKTFYGSASLR